MSSSNSIAKSSPLAKGDWCPASPTDIRGPCPVLNTLANHGYLPRDGRNARAADFELAMKQLGLSSVCGGFLSNPPFIEREADGKPKQRSFFAKIFYYLRNPWALFFSRFGVRKPGQRDSAGKPVINLDELSTPGVIEHDISLTRRDYAQGDNHTMQPDLVEALLASSSDGGKTLTLEDMVAFRKRRIAEQKAANPELAPDAPTNKVANGEIGLILHVFGDGKKVDCDRVRAIFMEQRLPRQEGWVKRSWWRSLGLLELIKSGKEVKALLDPA